MSILITSMAWEYSKSDGSTLLTLLAIADFANAQGVSYPSIATLAKKARISERMTQYAIAKLREMGELDVSIGTGPHGCNTYTVRVQSLQGANSAGVQTEAEGGERGCTRTVIEPSLKKKEKREREACTFSEQTGRITGIPETVKAKWVETFDGLNVDAEISRAECWLLSNPAKAKARKDFARFLNNWLTSAHKDLKAGRGARIASPASRPAARHEHHDNFGAFLHGRPEPTPPQGDSNVIDVVATEII